MTIIVGILLTSIDIVTSDIRDKYSHKWYY